MMQAHDPSLMIGDRRVSRADPCYVIAEIGVNHNGDLALARRLVEAAAEAGADAVKFQTFHTEDLVLPAAGKAEYQRKQTGSGSQAEMLARLELSFEQFAELRDLCASLEIDFLSTAFDARSLDEVLRLRPKALKWPSGEIDNFALLRQAAASGLPVILSTGMATLDEIGAALKVLDAARSGPVAILQCVSQYPAPMNEQNLRAIPELARQFNRVTGYSDHTDGPWAAVAARGLGMALLEKHITLDQSMDGPDHQASMEPAAFADMVSAIRMVEAALGDGMKRPMPSELDTRAVARKSLVYTRDLAAGSIVEERDLTAMRPGGAMSPSAIDTVVGSMLVRAVRAYDQVSADDLA
jgi:sialic acid synthase SpsE